MVFEEALRAAGVIICGSAERETVEQTTATVGGKSCVVTVWRRIGLCKYIDNGKERLADWATFVDNGPKNGISRNYTLHKDVEPTEAEREAGRRHIQAVATQAMIDQGIW